MNTSRESSRHSVVQADCPYLVGSYADIGARARSFSEKNVSTIILDVVADEEELDHVCKALASSGVFRPTGSR
jgi:alkanesulfonate monooxygenase